MTKCTSGSKFVEKKDIVFPTAKVQVMNVTCLLTVKKIHSTQNEEFYQMIHFLILRKENY